MKKKFLSLMMAAAVVATTSVSAFAADVNQSYDVSDTNGRDVQIGITGDVTDGSNNVVPSTISVTVPTATTFKVNSNGTFYAPDIKITSDNDEEVQVVAKSFTDSTDDEANSLTVVKESELPTDGSANSRLKVALKLKGTSGSVALASKNAKDGLLKADESDNAGENAVLGTVTRTSPLTLNLEGKVGANSVAPAKAVNDRFTLVLKIRKTR